jgi:hypothetical protein
MRASIVMHRHASIVDALANRAPPRPTPPPHASNTHKVAIPVFVRGGGIVCVRVAVMGVWEHAETRCTHCRALRADSTRFISLGHADATVCEHIAQHVGAD